MTSSFAVQEKKAKEQQKAQKKAAAAAAQSKKKDAAAAAKISPSVSGQTLEELACDDTLIPPFVTLCVENIEQEGVTSEGIYRVNGNRAQVELLYEKFKEGTCTRTLFATNT